MIERNELASAQDSLREALALARKTGLREHEIATLRNLSRIERKQSRLPAARKYLSLALEIAQKLGSTKEIAESASELTEVYVKMGDFRQALQSHRLAETMRDSLINEDKLKQIARLEFKQAVDAKERENDLLKKNMALQQAELDRDSLIRTGLFVGLGLLTVLTVVLVLAFVMKRRTNAQLDEMNRVIFKQNTQLRALNDKKNEFLGVVAHDLRNPIGAIANAIEIVSVDVDPISSAENRALLADTLASAWSTVSWM